MGLERKLSMLIKKKTGEKMRRMWIGPSKRSKRERKEQ